MNENNPGQFKLKVPFKVPLSIGGFVLPWFEAFQVAKLDQKPETTGGKIAGAIVPSWYSAFKVASLTPFKDPKSEWKHTLGKILVPWYYTPYQLAKMKSPTVTNGEKFLALLLGPLYGTYASTVINERQKNTVNSYQSSPQPMNQAPVYQRPISQPAPYPYPAMNYQPVQPYPPIRPF